jgi:hypothetical protein
MQLKIAGSDQHADVIVLPCDLAVDAKNRTLMRIITGRHLVPLKPPVKIAQATMEQYAPRSDFLYDRTAWGMLAYLELLEHASTRAGLREDDAQQIEDSNSA